MKKLLSTIIIFSLFTSFKPKEITWVAIGDSITYLNDHLSETGNRLTKGYLTRVSEKLPNIHYINQGHNGWTSINMAASIDRIGIVKADVYTIFLGTNDWWNDKPIGSLSDYQNNTGNKTVYGSFRIIVNKLRSLNAGAKFILITPMQRSDFVYINSYKNNAWGSYRNNKTGLSLSQYADAVIKIGEYEDFDVVDLYNKSRITQKNLINFKRLKDPATSEYKNYRYPHFVDVLFNADKDEYPYPVEAMNMTYDGLHPSDKGCAVISKMLVKVMKRY